MTSPRGHLLSGCAAHARVFGSFCLTPALTTGNEPSVAALLRRLPLPRQPLRLGDLVGGHFGGQFVARLLCVVIALRGRQVVPHVGENVVLRDAVALLVHEAEVGLGEGIVLIGRLAVPFRCFAVVLWRAMAVLVHAAQHSLTVLVGLIGRFAIPFHRFGIVLRDTSAVLVHETEASLTILGALLGRFAVGFCRFAIVLRHASTVCICRAEENLRGRVALI